MQFARLKVNKETDSLFLNRENRTVVFFSRIFQKSVGCRYSFVVCQGKHLTRGSRLEDFDIRLGNAVCVPLSPLAVNEVNCRPPTKKPKKNVNDTFCHPDALSLRASNNVNRSSGWWSSYPCCCYAEQHNELRVAPLVDDKPVLSKDEWTYGRIVNERRAVLRCRLLCLLGVTTWKRSLHW